MMHLTLTLATACLASSMVTNLTEAPAPGFSVTKTPLKFGPISELKEPNKDHLRYGTIQMMQLSSDKVLAMVNRGVYTKNKNYDFEDGTDLFVLGALDDVKTAKPIPLNRSGVEPDPAYNGTPRYHNRYPGTGGFVPFGAKVGGKPHPYAGTGIILAVQLTYPVAEDGTFDWNKGNIYGSVMEYALAYDGKDLSVKFVSAHHGDDAMMIGTTGWKILQQGMTTFVPDGVDMLSPAQSRRVKDGAQACGLCRWKCIEGRWRPVDFVPVAFDSKADQHRYYETSLVRDGKGDLVIGVRDDGRHLPGKPHFCSPTQDLNAWRSTDGGKSWAHIVRIDHVRHAAPMTIGRTVGGSIFFVSNPIVPGRTDPADFRSRVNIWPVSADYAKVYSPIVVRDAYQDGFRPGDTIWMLDHTTSQVLRLADGKLHSYLFFRARDPHFNKKGGVGVPSEDAGAYIEEIITRETPIPLWEF